MTLIEVEVTNLTRPNEGREYPIPGGKAVGPGETATGVFARPLQLKELTVNRDLRVEQVAVHEEEAPSIDLDASEERLAAAEEELTGARGHVGELEAKATDLQRRIADAEEREYIEKKEAALESRGITAVASEVGTLREQAEETSYALWAARVRLHEAEAAVYAARMPVATAKERKLKQELSKAEERVRKAESQRDRIKAELQRVPDTFGLGRKARQARLEAAEVEKTGPDA